MRLELDVTTLEISKYLVPDQGDIDLDNILIACKTRDCLDDVAARLYQRLFTNITMGLREYGDVEECDDFSDPHAQYSSFGWRNHNWPQGITVSIGFEKIKLNELVVGIVAPNSRALDEMDAEDRNHYTVVAKSFRDQIHSEASTANLFGGIKCHKTNAWPVCYWFSALHKATATDALLMLSGARAYKGENLTNYLKRDIASLMVIVDKAL